MATMKHAWTATDDAELARRHALGHSPERISLFLGRTTLAVYCRLKGQGLLPPRQPRRRRGRTFVPGDRVLVANAPGYAPDPGAVLEVLDRGQARVLLDSGRVTRAAVTRLRKEG